MLREQIRRHKILFELGQTITSEMNLEALFELIMQQTNQLMDTERCSVFLFDAGKKQLWSLVSTDLAKNEVRIPATHGVAGWVFQNKTSLIINDAYTDPRFLPEVDKKTGYKTRNILCIPLVNRQKECIGTLQTLNKKRGDFTEEDQELLTSASHYMAIALENAKLYEDLKLLDKAKERVINHLSHELRTPLAMISAVFKRIQEGLENEKTVELDRTLDRGRRNLRRLMDLQEKIDDILGQKLVEEKKKILDIIQSAADLLWTMKETHRGLYAGILELLSKQLDALFSMDETHVEEINVGRFLNDLCDRTLVRMGEREVKIVRGFDEGLLISMDRKVLEKVCEGLLKNAIENTPDEGIIEITAMRQDGEIWILFHDYGVGITPQNQQMIFGGFFHTQDTNFYSSKRPYEFNAGGSGSDLLRTKCFSERYGFTVDFESTRCKFIPDDRDLCPGRISKCTSITDPSQCLSSGESAFVVKFHSPSQGSPAAHG